MNNYNLLIESSDKVEVLTEQTSDGKKLYIEGIFAQAEVVNGNRRLYERNVMEPAIEKYINEFVSKRRALGELNHPDYPMVDPAEAAIRITELKWDGNDVYGKALVLNTPKGKIVEGLLDGGFNMGVSTRALGSLKEKNGINYPQSDLMFTAVDCVDNPSAPSAYVNKLIESKQWLINESGVWVSIDNEKETFDQDLFLERFEDLLKKIKRGS